MNAALLSTSKVSEYDPRFANHNVMKQCWLNYVNYYNCAASKGEEACLIENSLLKKTCAGRQVAKWDKYRRQGLFPGLATKIQGTASPDFDEDEDFAE